MKKLETTLFMLSSLDGKITSGINGSLEIDEYYHRIKGIKEGVEQYYDLEKKTDLCSLNTGRVMSKIGINEKKVFDLIFMDFVIIDNSHLSENGVKNLASGLRTLFLVTKNKNHPAFNLKIKNVEIIFYEEKINFQNLFQKMAEKYRIEKITIQSGGTMNSILLRENLIDKISIVYAPALVGGKNTPTLVDGESLSSEKDLKNVKALELISCQKLKNSFLHLEYKVIKNTEIVK